MPNLKDIKSRISSVQNTKKITKAMKMVAAAKVKKAENTVKAARPFSDELLHLFRKMLATVGEYSVAGLHVQRALDNYPELLEKREIKTDRLQYTVDEINSKLDTIIDNQSRIYSDLLDMKNKGDRLIRETVRKAEIESKNNRT